MFVNPLSVSAFNTTSFYGANNYNNEDCACVMYYPWHGVDDTITNDVDCSTELIALCQKHECMYHNIFITHVPY